MNVARIFSQKLTIKTCEHSLSRFLSFLLLFINTIAETTHTQAQRKKILLAFSSIVFMVLTMKWCSISCDKYDLHKTTWTHLFLSVHMIWWPDRGTPPTTGLIITTFCSVLLKFYWSTPCLNALLIG